MKKRTVMMTLAVLTVTMGVGNVNALSREKALELEMPSNEKVMNTTIRYYKEYTDKDLAKEYIMQEYKEELEFLSLKYGSEQIDIDNKDFQSFIMGDPELSDSKIDNSRFYELERIIDIYENNEKNDEIKNLKNQMLLESTRIIKTTDSSTELETLMPIDSSDIENGKISTTRYSNGYNPTAAINYAHQWAMSANTSKYIEYKSDCTNFVSQCLYEGGMKAYYKAHWPVVGNIIQEDAANWYFYDENNKKAPSYSWTGTGKFYTHWKNRGATVVTVLGELSVGDPLGCDWEDDGDINHFVIVDGKSSGVASKITYSGHSKSRMNEPLTTLYNEDRRTFLYGLKVANAKN